MGSVAVSLLLVLGLLLLVMMAVEYAKGEEDLLSLRNMFLLGFIVFQLTSGAIPVLFDYTDQYVYQDLQGIAVHYTVWTLLFVGVFLYAYKKGWGAKQLARSTPALPFPPGQGAIFVLIFLCLGVGSAFRFVPIPLIGIITDMVGLGLLAISAGLAAWFWARRPLDPIAAGLLGVVTIGAGLISQAGNFGRRPLVAVAAAAAWGAYFSRWRYSKPTALMFRLTVLSLPAVLALAALSTVRGGIREMDFSVRGTAELILSGDPEEGVIKLLGGQGTGHKSMWLMENYPEPYAYDTLLMARYIFMFPIPRDWWPAKPEPLSTRIAVQAQLKGVDQDRLTIGPGVIGHAAGDGGIWVVPIYAVLLALVLRYGDELMRNHPFQPLVVMPVGCSLGQVLGLSRGETSVFLGNFLIAAVGTYIFFFIVGRFFVRNAPALPAGDDDGYDPYEFMTDEEREELVELEEDIPYGERPVGS
ncbi:MAG: hypothetical protein AAF995_01340 [Planctomycetota bacterium]